ncbi:hypothetical protein PO909_018666 [Leuciscus waleckii]
MVMDMTIMICLVLAEEDCYTAAEESSLSPPRPPRRHLNRITQLILNRLLSKQIMRIFSSCPRLYVLGCM